MNPITVISAVSAIASLLSIVFDIPNKQKVSVSLKTFILILSVISLLFIWWFSPYFMNAPLDESLPSSSSESTDEPENGSASDPTGGTDTDSDDGATGALTNGPMNDPSNAQTLQVAPILSCPYTASPIAMQSYEVAAIDIEEISGDIYETDQRIDYEFIPQISGTHRFEFSNVPNGTDFRLDVYNSGWERLDSRSDLDNGDGLTISLSADETYYLSVQQYYGVGHYTLNIGAKKAITDISSFTSVSDSIQYIDQKNDYAFSVGLSGRYRFEFSDVPDGTDLWLGIYNSGWEKMNSKSDLDNGDGLSVNLDEGELYYLRVAQYHSLGSYTLNIGPQKPVIDISSFTSVSDSIQYTDQQNDYAFSVGLSGWYRFEFSDVPDGTDLWLGIYNSGWEKMNSNFDLDNGDGLTVSLDANKKYFIRVMHYNKLGEYTLNIGTKKAIADISFYTAVFDSIQYTDQQNDYSFSAGLSGGYRFEFSDVPDGTNLWLRICNSGWETIASDSPLDNGGGLTVAFDAGKTYFIQVTQLKNHGNYTLNIIRQDD